MFHQIRTTGVSAFRARMSALTSLNMMRSFRQRQRSRKEMSRDSKLEWGESQSGSIPILWIIAVAKVQILMHDSSLDFVQRTNASHTTGRTTATQGSLYSSSSSLVMYILHYIWRSARLHTLGDRSRAMIQALGCPQRLANPMALRRAIDPRSAGVVGSTKFSGVMYSGEMCRSYK